MDRVQSRKQLVKLCNANTGKVAWIGKRVVRSRTITPHKGFVTVNKMTWAVELNAKTQEWIGYGVWTVEPFPKFRPL